VARIWRQKNKESKKEIYIYARRAKIILEIVKEGPKTFTEIKNEYSKKGQDTEKIKDLDKTLRRALGNLEYIGIIKKGNDGRWWYVEHEVVIEKEYYDKAMNHSLIILPAFVEISKEYGAPLKYIKLPNVQQPLPSYDYSDTPYYSKKIVIDYAKEHLKTGYPEVWEAINKALTSFKELEKLKEQEEIEKSLLIYFEWKLRRRILLMPGVKPSNSLEVYITILAQHIFSEFLEAKEPNNEIDLESIFNENEKDAALAGLPSLGYDYRKPIKEEVLKLLSAIKEEIKKHGIEETKTLERIEEDRTEKEKSFIKNALVANKELLKIIYNVESGEPLKGKCSGCPRVYLYYQPEKETSVH
jgi:hypothetical protein